MSVTAKGWTRGRLLRAALGTGAVVAGGAATANWTGGSAPLAAPSADTDARILNLFLLLERVQEAFYREALRTDGLDAELQRFARTAGGQEREHVALLTARLGDRARERPQSDFGAALADPKRFRDAAIALEETTLSAYIAQGANLTRDAVAAVVPMVSVEARQVAWVRDLAGVNPAPNAADPPRSEDEVMSQLRDRGFIQ
jgi:hypothetical protein